LTALGHRQLNGSVAVRPPRIRTIAKARRPLRRGLTRAFSFPAERPRRGGGRDGEPDEITCRLAVSKGVSMERWRIQAMRISSTPTTAIATAVATSSLLSVYGSLTRFRVALPDRSAARGSVPERPRAALRAGATRVRPPAPGPRLLAPQAGRCARRDGC